jgi:carbonic anhydrase/acetyltransferase-like protein (isoleucine patch superfamily)
MRADCGARLSDEEKDQKGKQLRSWEVRALGSIAAATILAGTLAIWGHEHDAVFLIIFPALCGYSLFQGMGRLAKRGYLPTWLAPVDRSAAHIGIGAEIGRGAIVEPGAIVEMGADVGEGAIIRSGAVVRMGASVGKDVIVEAGAVISWGADVKRGAHVLKGARVGAGATVGKHSVVPEGTWILPASDWKGADARTGQPARTVGTPTIATATIGAPALGTPMVATQSTLAPIVDPRQAKLDAVFARIDSELALSPETLREHLKVSASGVTTLRATCKSLLERERSLRAEANPEAIARLDAEKAQLEKKIAATDDEVVRLSLASAVAAIEEQKKQRQLLARNADRLDAEATRLYWTLDALAAQLVRMRSAGAEMAQGPDAELTKSVERLQGEIVAIADALEQVTKDDRAPSASSSPQLGAAPPDAVDAEAARLRALGNKSGA